MGCFGGRLLDARLEKDRNFALLHVFGLFKAGISTDVDTRLLHRGSRTRALLLANLESSLQEIAALESESALTRQVTLAVDTASQYEHLTTKHLSALG